MNDSDPSPARPPEIRSWWGRLLVGRRPRRTLVRLCLVVALLLGLSKWWLVPVRVTGSSMEPTYQSGRIGLVNRLAYHQRRPERGDVVSIRREGQRMTLLKRVLGLPGEGVQVRDGRVLINGQPLEEPYAQGRDVPSMRRPVLLKKDEFFVIGDNRDLSEYGIVNHNDIRGKLLF